MTKTSLYPEQQRPNYQPKYVEAMNENRAQNPVFFRGILSIFYNQNHGFIRHFDERNSSQVYCIVLSFGRQAYVRISSLDESRVILHNHGGILGRAPN